MGELDFRASAPSQARSSRVGITLAFALVGLVGLLLMRSRLEPRVPEGALVEVRGDVPRPGHYVVDPPTIAAAVRAAGGEPTSDGPLSAGDRVIVEDGAARVAPPTDALLVALPIDVNTCTETELLAIPGVGPSIAEAVVADRGRRGPFYEVEDLRRVPGIGPSTLDALRPFVTVGDVGPRPPPRKLDLNTATAAELERLPGIGAVTAARIVVAREEGGAFRSVQDLDRVKGIGPKTIADLAPLVTP